MRCPVDQAELVMSERQGVEIDYCPTCRGIWLDRGELDKILDRAAAPDPGLGSGPARPAEPRPEDRRGYDDRRGFDDRRGYDDRRGTPDPRYADPRYADPRHAGDPRYRRKKKESWLEDLFDF
ncbi:zf-TFIIB domain-containing protein [Cellulomonas fimi]|uniref:Transcription factor zinc-finger domain-containing protein n=1 Tax=Cellulomonas fimi (strain ATCC 484 / DSM 20113 / JCM 1341 / CCUG 24087 / LMG 16345 / NBRC 15513 / NCIMB 8980 / NCTC 7547 / NRS-133) TaxID=590998 RepID=F4H5C4_CELFA|nr:zf-TFIIB domain-containing protein [Cellulomonas fimi]AEE47847.1 hypothetical protein Celf_3741 [Cellulomonas fimi ATCC 484]NNH06015.1 hypothetical protein [Cellulomonas fimi]